MEKPVKMAPKKPPEKEVTYKDLASRQLGFICPKADSKVFNEFGDLYHCQGKPSLHLLIVDDSFDFGQVAAWMFHVLEGEDDPDPLEEEEEELDDDDEEEEFDDDDNDEEEEDTLTF